MSRHGYSDDCDNILDYGRWRAQVCSAIRGRRGQAFLKELLEAMEAMPNKRLIDKELRKGGSEVSDQINHPSHYNRGKIEVIEFLEDQELDFHCANAVKYVCRAGHKDPTKTVEDLEKAIWYLKRKVEVLKAEEAGSQPRRPNDMDEGLRDTQNQYFVECEDIGRQKYEERVEKENRFIKDIRGLVSDKFIPKEEG